VQFGRSRVLRDQTIVYNSCGIVMVAFVMWLSTVLNLSLNPNLSSINSPVDYNCCRITFVVGRVVVVDLHFVIHIDFVAGLVLVDALVPVDDPYRVADTLRVADLFRVDGLILGAGAGLAMKSFFIANPIHVTHLNLLFDIDFI
jgi:hypothetical protein